MPKSEVSRRERKKLRTRELIISTARELFVERGYHETSMSEIAERADIGVSTIFDHFRSKSDLLFSGMETAPADLIEAIESRPEGESAIEATIRWHSQMHEGIRRLGSTSPEIRWYRDLLKIVDGDAALLGLMDEQWVPAREALARAIAEDLGDQTADLRPQLISATKTALYMTLGRRLASTDDGFVLSAPEQQYVEECLRSAARAIAAVPLPSPTLGDPAERREPQREASLPGRGSSAAQR